LHLLERESVFSARDLESHALTQYQYAGPFTVDDVRAELERRLAAGLLLSGVGLKGETLYTTKGVLDAEENSILFAWRGRGKAKPLGSALQVSLMAALADERGKTLNKEQAEAFSHLALSCDQITGFHGKGGAGKTFVFTKLATLATLEGVTTKAFAPTLSAVETLNREGLPAVTLQSFLLSKTVSPSVVPELWLLDEATMVGADDMEVFLRRVRAVNARVVLAGDVRQFGSVPAGRSFEQLLRYGLPSVKLTKVIRQNQSPEPVKRAVHLASERKTKQALALLDEAGRVDASADPVKRVARIAELYSSFSGETLVVVATNQERHEVNEAVRNRRKELGEVAMKGVSTEVYLNKNLSKASRREARFYDKGDVLRFAYVRDKRLSPRVWYRVVGGDLTNNLVTIKDQDGRRFTYNPQENHLIDDVYRTERREFAIGDKVELRRKEKHLGLFAGQVGTVVAVDRKTRVLTLKTRSGETKPVNLAQYKTLDYGYASTGHSAQSRTVENVIVLLTSEHRQEVVNLASFYVGTSRTTGELFIVTDDLAGISRKLTREHQKVTAIDIVPARKLELSLDPLAAG
jgi:ATP-dependent exoDNAse (exonuclease V) alpha subunit